MADRLTIKQRLFVEHYLGDARGNATEAARLAGYKGKVNTLSVVGFENLRKPNIACLLESRVTEAAMPANEVLSQLSDIARADWRDHLTIKYNADGDVVGAKLGLNDKIKALELLGKHHRLFDRAGEAVNLLAQAKAAIAQFMADHPSAKLNSILPIYAEQYGVTVEQISDAVN